MYRVLISILLLFPSVASAISIEQGAFTATSGTQTITMRGSFTPQCGIIWWTIHTSTGFTSNASMSISMGKFGTSSEYGTNMWSTDAAPSSIVSATEDDDQMLALEDATTQGGFDFGSASAGSFSITWGSSANVPDSAYRMFYMVIGGVTDCGCSGWTPGNGATSGSYSVNVGTQPDALIVLSAGYVCSNCESFDAQLALEHLAFGAATDTTKQWVAAGFGLDNQVAMDNKRFFYNDRVGCITYSTTLSQSAMLYFGAFDATGWRWTYARDQGDQDASWGYMWIKGGGWLAGSGTTPTSTGTQSITTTFQPNGIILGSSVRTATAAYADDYLLGLGGGSDASGNEGSIFVSDDDALNDADANTNVSTTKVLAVDDAHDGTMSLAADVSAFNTTSAVLDWTSVLGSAQYYGYLIGGTPPVTRKNLWFIPD